ncbi:hypothetical protein GC209_08760 [bacterium]|nr:hypothetical protein [bacterium]
MAEKPLNRAEQDVLAVLCQRHAQQGPVDRAALSVEVRGRGLEFGRALGRLIALGLAEEITRKPFFLFRLFGARAVVLLRPTAAGLAQGQPQAEHAIPPEAPTETPAEKPAETHVQPPAAAAMDQPAADQNAAVEAAPAQPAKAKAKPKPRPRPITAFTEDLGGAPLPLAAPALPASVDPALLAGLRETLSVMGLDLTPAGEALAANRIAKGASAAEALSQVVLFAFGHAVSQDLYRGGPVADLGLRDYAGEVLREVAKLRDAGELPSAAYDRDTQQLWALLNDSPDRAAQVRALLADPVGGAAPPAVLPEELRRSDED